MYIINGEKEKVELTSAEKEHLEKVLKRCYRNALFIDDGLGDVLEMGGMLETISMLLYATVKTACSSLGIYYGDIFFEEGDNVPWGNVCVDINRRFGTNYSPVAIPDVNEM